MNRFNQRLVNFCTVNKNLIIVLFGLIITIGASTSLFVGPYNDFSASTQLNVTLFLILACVCIILSLLFFIYCHLKLSIKINYILVFFVLLFTITNIISVSLIQNDTIFNIIASDKTHITLVQSISTNDKLVFIFRGFLFNICFYSLIAICPWIIKKGKYLRYLFYLLFVFIILNFLYSLIFNFDQFRIIFDPTTGVDYSFGVSGFFLSKNSFGTLIGFEIVFSMMGFLIDNIGKKKYALIGIINFIFLLFTLSKTIIAIILLLLLIFGIYLFVYTFKNHKRRNLVFMSAVVVLLVVFLLCVFLTPLKDFFKKIIIEKGGKTLDTRLVLWDKTLQISNRTPATIIIGSGFGYFSIVLHNTSALDLSCAGNANIKTAHNSYLHAYGTGGVILLLFVFYIFAYCFYLIYKLRKENKNESLAFLLFVLFVAIRGIVEA